LGLLGTIPWKEQSVVLRNLREIFIAYKVRAYIRFMPLSASMKTLLTSYPPI
jgi:hypothetical protein